MDGIACDDELILLIPTPPITTVVAMDGHTYSRQGLEEWFQRCRTGTWWFGDWGVLGCLLDVVIRFGRY